VATALVEGPKAGLDALDVLAADAHLKGHYRLDAVRAHLREKAGDREVAVAHYRKAAARTSSVPERKYLVTRAERSPVHSIASRTGTRRYPRRQGAADQLAIGKA
jgi:predicted RNA polymerase sigma factor